MARIVVIGAGMAGHSAALGLKHRLKDDHDVIVISPSSTWTNPDVMAQIASGLQLAQRQTVQLGPLYRRKGIIFHQGMATAVYPKGYRDDPRPQVQMTFTGSHLEGQVARVPYDYLVIATGHDIDRVAGIPAEATTVPTCVLDRLDSAIAGEAELRRLLFELQDSPVDDKPKVIAIGRSARGMGGFYGALEYALCVDEVLRAAFLRSRVELHFFDAGRPWMYGHTDEPKMEEDMQTALVHLIESHRLILHQDMRLASINGRRVRFVPVHGEGQPGEMECDLVAVEAARVLTPLSVYDANGADLRGDLYDGWGRLRVDAKTQQNGSGQVVTLLPRTFRNPTHRNIFGIGSAIAMDTRELVEGKDSAPTPVPMQTRDMAHLMSRQVSDLIIEELTGQKNKVLPETLEEIETVLSLCWDYGLISSRGFYAELTYPKKSSDAARQVLRVRHGLGPYWAVRTERFLERYRAKGRALWWMLPS